MGATGAPAFEFKIVVAGPYAAGKTSLIRAASDRPVVGTEVPTSGDEAHIKESTTVGMEYGAHTVADADLRVHLDLYGVPGQTRFAYMWDIVARGMDGLVFLVDALAPDTWEAAGDAFRAFQGLAGVPVVLAVNHGLGHPELVDTVLAAMPPGAAACVACDVTDTTSARDVVIELLLHVLDQLPDDDDRANAEGTPA